MEGVFGDRGQMAGMSYSSWASLERTISGQPESQGEVDMERTRKTAGLRAGIAVGLAIALLGIAVGVTVASIPASGGRDQRLLLHDHERPAGH